MNVVEAGIAESAFSFYAHDFNLADDRTLHGNDKVLPYHLSARVLGRIMCKPDKLVSRGEYLGLHKVDLIPIVEHSEVSAVPGHENADIAVVQIAADPHSHHMCDPVIAASHFSEIGYGKKLLYVSDRQLNDSSLWIIC